MHKEEKKPELFTIPAETSWHFERILKPDDKTIGNYVLIQPGASDIAKVLKAYFHHPVENYNIASIEIVYNEQLNRLFYAQMKMMNVRAGNPKYTPTWKTETHGQENQHRNQVYQQLKQLSAGYGDPDIPNVMLLPLWHGTNDDVVDYIFNMGYGIFTGNNPRFVTDEGFFGKGVYTAHEAEYSFRAYAKKHGSKAVLLLNWVSTFEAYPVIDGDMPNLRGKIGGYDQSDSHFIPVRSDQHPNTIIYYPCAFNQPHQYTEMVVFTPSQCLPRYRVKLLQSAPKHGIDDTANMMYQMGLDALGLGQYSMVSNAFEQANDVGHPGAMVRLHWLHSGASGVVPANTNELAKYQNISTTSINILKQKANFRGENDKESQFNLGWCYQHGLGTEKNLSKAAKYYWMAASQGHKDAQYQLGVCCSAGIGVKQDMQKAIYYYEQAALQGHVHANYLLYQCYEWGLGVLPNAIKAANYKLAAQKGHHPQLVSLGMPLVPQSPSAEDKKKIAQLEQTLKDKEIQLQKQKENLEQEKQKNNQLTQSLSKEKQESQNKEKVYQQSIGVQQQQLAQKDAEVQMKDSKVMQLEKALQEASDREMSLQLQLKEYQKQAKQAGIQSPSSSSSTASTPFWINNNSTTNIINTSAKFQPTLVQQEELKALLKWVVEGHLLEADKLLSKNRQLTLLEGTVTDLSGREFKNITPLQYAFWSLDVEMIEVILKYLDKGEALNQLKAFESNPGKYSQYGVHYDVRDLAKKTQEYVDNYKKWDYEQCQNHWQKEVGGAQRMCPAWMIYGMCEEGENAAWCKKDARDVGKKREYEKEWTNWWFNFENNGGVLGFKFGIVRGRTAKCGNSYYCEWCTYADGWYWPSWHGAKREPSCAEGVIKSRHDVEVHVKSNENRIEAVENLKAELAKQSSVNPSSQSQAQQQELNALLKWVVEGHLIEAENLLKKMPELSLMEGNVTDLSGREFKNITPLQYAFWALDVEMIEVILKYLDKGEAFNQITAFERNPEKYSQYGVQYDVSDLVNKMQGYIKNYSKWNEDECENYWQTEVGGAQRQCPAWMIYGMCEEGKEAAWCNQDAFKVGKKRQYDKNWTNWWFNVKFNNGVLGSKFGMCRGSWDFYGRTGAIAPKKGREDNNWTLRMDAYYHDLNVHTKVNKSRKEVVENLKITLASHASKRPGFKQ